MSAVPQYCNVPASCHCVFTTGESPEFSSWFPQHLQYLFKFRIVAPSIPVTSPDFNVFRCPSSINKIILLYRLVFFLLLLQNQDWILAFIVHARDILHLSASIIKF
ncbi:UNVERIFIED_CONTAM: hypothetical protein FKN15_014091 [Acipenser sinensis]